MAKRRMFSLEIVDTDDFLDMPASTQNLYFHLGMHADDDGFISNPRKITTSVNCSNDDLKLLVMKGYVIPFESGICVIRDWKQNNYIQTDRYRPTIHQREKRLIGEEAGQYFLLEQPCIQTVSKMYTQDRLGKVSLGKDRVRKGKVIQSSSIEEDSCDRELPHTPENQRKTVMDSWNNLSSYGIAPIKAINENTKRAEQLRARISQYGIAAVLEAIENIRCSHFLQGHNDKCWVITFDWFISPNNFPKVYEGNYADRSEKKPAKASGSDNPFLEMLQGNCVVK